MINVIVAIDSNNGFSKEKRIPWYYSDDFKHFRILTTNHICVMGRNTYQEINEKLGDKAKSQVLPNRISLVLSNTLQELPNAQVIQNVDELKYVLDNVKEIKDKEVFLIGGKQIFDLGLDIADRIYVTHINKNYECDEFFDISKLNNQFSQKQILSTLGDLTFCVYSRG